MRKFLVTLCGLLMTSMVATSAFSQSSSPPKQCEAPAVDQKKIDGITTTYKERLSELANSSKKESDSVDKEAPRKGSLGVDSHLETRTFKFKLHVPEITMSTNSVALDVPEVKATQRKFSMDKPTVITGQDCRAGVDETVIEWKTCHNDIPPFDYPCSETRTRRGADICLPTVKVENRREEFFLDVPEVKMVRQDFKLSVPTIKMVLMEMSVDHPVLIVDSVTLKEKAAKEKASAAQNKHKIQHDKITAAMKEELKSITFAPIEASYKCSLEAVDAKEKEALAQINAMIEAFEAGYKKAIETKSPDAINAFEKTLKTLKESRSKTMQSFLKMRTEYEKMKRKKLEAL